MARNRFFTVFENVIYYYKGIALTLVVGGIGAGIFYGYSTYRQKIDRHAQKQFVECMKYFEAPITFNIFPLNKLFVLGAHIGVSPMFKIGSSSYYPFDPKFNSGPTLEQWAMR